MPGIAGIAASEADANQSIAAGGQSLADALRLEPSWALETRQDREASSAVALAQCSRDPDRAARSIASADGDTLVMEGEIFCHGDGDPAEVLLRGWQANGLGFFRELEGRFVAAIWSAGSARLTLLADKFASKPLYYRQGSPFAFATSIRALLACGDAAPEANLHGLIQFFTYGQLWNHDTFHESVRCLPPGGVCEWDAATGRLEQSCYWRPSPSGEKADEAASLERVSTALHDAVRQQTDGVDGLGVALSGGLDARTVLGLIAPGQSAPCVSLGMLGSLDQRSASELAAIAGQPYHQQLLGEGFLEGFEAHLHRMVDLTDGHYLSQCIEMPTLPLYPRLGIGVLLRGHAGELLHMHKAYNFSVDGEFSRVRDSASLQRWLAPRLQSHLTAGVAEPLLCGVSAEEFNESGRRTLREALDWTDHLDHPLDRLSQLFLDQRTRRETAMSLVEFDSVVDVRVPYLDSRVINAVFAAPPSLRVGERLQTHTLRRHRPQMLRPANSNTGARVGASEAWKTLCYYRMKVLAKLGVRGYQPYERLGLWLRRELREVVKRTLLAPECLDRGLLNPDCVRNVIERHNAGRANHTFLIMAMMIVELGLKRSVGGPDAPRVEPQRSSHAGAAATAPR